MTPRVEELIQLLDLQPHPEGGHYREVYRSPCKVSPSDARQQRAALTTIYFLLADGQHARVHRVAADEVWHHYEGGPMELLWWDADWQLVDRMLLGPVSPRNRPLAVVPAGCWQAAFPTGKYALVGCTVAPGFDFADFELLGDTPATAAEFKRANPEWTGLV